VGRIGTIHRASLANFPEAFTEFDRVWVYGNTEVGNPRLVLETEAREVGMKAEHQPEWLGRIMSERLPGD
jgi:predicted ABC-type ATPase